MNIGTAAGRKTLAVMQKRPNHDLQYFKRRFSCA